VLKQEADWASFYSAAPNLPPGLLREVARYAGVHIYTEHDDVLYADRGFLALHTVRGETKTVRLPHPADVWEVFSNRQVAAGSDTFQDRMEAGGTNLYYCGVGPRP